MRPRTARRAGARAAAAPAPPPPRAPRGAANPPPRRIRHQWTGRRTAPRARALPASGQARGALGRRPGALGPSPATRCPPRGRCGARGPGRCPRRVPDCLRAPRAPPWCMRVEKPRRARPQRRLHGGRSHAHAMPAAARRRARSGGRGPAAGNKAQEPPCGHAPSGMPCSAPRRNPPRPPTCRLPPGQPSASARRRAAPRRAPRAPAAGAQLPLTPAAPDISVPLARPARRAPAGRARGGACAPRRGPSFFPRPEPPAARARGRV
jgi:hypothetical protein